MNEEEIEMLAQQAAGLSSAEIEAIARGAAEGAREPAPIDDLGRQIGLTGRSIAQGAAGIAGLAYDPIAATQNYLFGTDVAPLREQVKKALTEIGVPEPESAMERIVGAIGEGVVGAGGQAAIARGAGSMMTGGGQQVARQLASQPGAQAMAGGGSGAGAQAVSELGGGPLAQTAAALAGGVLGGRAATTTTQAAPGALPETIRDASDAGVRVMTTDVVPPTTFAGRWLQRTGEMIPAAGTGGPRAAQQQERIDASADLLRNYGVAEASAADNTILANVANDLMKRRGDRLTKYTGMKTEVIDRVGEGAGTVDVSRSVSQIDKEINRLEGISPTQFKPIVDRLRTWRDDLTGTREVTLDDGTTQIVSSGQPLKAVEVLRKQIGESFTDPSLAAVRGEGEKVLSRIYGPLREDMGAFIKANGERRDFDKWNISNRQLSQMAGELELGVMRNALAKGEATPEVIRTMLFSAKPSDVKSLYRGLSAEGKRNARTAVLQEAFNKVGGNFENLSPDQFKRQLTRLASPIGVFFSGEDLRAVEGLVRTLRATERAGQAAVSPPTGVQAVPVVGAAVLTDILGGAGAGIVGGATVGGIARLYESAPVRNLLLKIPQVKAGSPEEMELVKRLTAALRAESAAEENAEQ